MHGSVPRKLVRLGWSLALHPRYAWRYLLRGPWSPRSPLELGIPWFSEAAIDFLEGYLAAGMTAFEWGAGGSTVYLAARTGAVTSVENDAAWIARVRERLAREGQGHVEFLHRPYDFAAATAFEDSAYLHAIDGRTADVIVVDGAEENVQVRPRCFYLAERHVRPGGIIVVDDAWRYPELRERTRARMRRTFQSTGPCRPGVTSTDVHFY